MFNRRQFLEDSILASTAALACSAGKLKVSDTDQELKRT